MSFRRPMFPPRRAFPLSAAVTPDDAAGDPIYAAIERNRELSAQYDAAEVRSSNMPAGPAFDAADAMTQQAMRDLLDHSDSMVYAEPATLAGVSALLRYVSTWEDWQLPRYHKVFELPTATPRHGMPHFATPWRTPSTRSAGWRDGQHCAIPQIFHGAVRFPTTILYLRPCLNGSHGSTAVRMVCFTISAAAYTASVEAHCAAEGKVSAEEYAYLQAYSSRAFDNMMLMARVLVICGAGSRAGWIALARYLEQQFNELEACKNGGMYMPDEVNGKPWPQVLMRTLALALRKMGAEFPEPKRKRTARRSKPSA